VPIFTDEAIYSRWTQIAKQDASWRFISLTDGKQPLFVWINILFMHVVHDPLLSGRLVSVTAGFLTMIGLFFLGKELFKKSWIGFISMLLYIVYPFALVYDRMAIYDSLVGTFYIWSLYVGILLVKRVRLDIAFILGFVLGGGALNKSIGLYSMYLLPLNLLLFNTKEKKKWQSLGRWVLFAGVSAVIAEIMYAILRLSPWFYIIKQKDSTFFYPLTDLLYRPVTFWLQNFSGNFHGLVSWLIPYSTWPMLVLVLFAFVFYKEFFREKVLLFLYFIIPFVTLPLIPLMSYWFFKLYEKRKNLYSFIVAFIILISLMLYADFYILTDFARAPIPQSDLNQYINDWPAGGGVKEAVHFFSDQAKTQKMYIGTEGTFGLMPYALEMYLVDNPNISIHGFWPIKDTPPNEAITMSKTMPTYFLFYQPCPSCSISDGAPITWPVHLISQYKKGVGNTYLRIYQIHP
jgi:hypothetical protein